MGSAWPIKPSPSVGLLIFIALLHIVENLVQSTIRVTKILAIALLIILKLRSGGSGAKYISDSINVVLAALFSSLNPVNTSPQSSLELSLWSALARRGKDIALVTLGQLSKYPFVDWLEKKSKETPENTVTVRADETATSDAKPSEGSMTL